MWAIFPGKENLQPKNQEIILMMGYWGIYLELYDSNICSKAIIF